MILYDREAVSLGLIFADGEPGYAHFRNWSGKEGQNKAVLREADLKSNRSLFLFLTFSYKMRQNKNIVYAVYSNLLSDAQKPQNNTRF